MLYLNFFQQVNINESRSNNSRRCILEVHLKYPEELHELHSDYPLAWDQTEIKTFLSDYQLRVAREYNIAIGNDKKLVSTFFDKEKYVLHYEKFSAKVEFSPPNLLTSSFNFFSTLLSNFKYIPNVSPKLLNLNQEHPTIKLASVVKS